jgi:hypothetical protein
MSYLKKKKELYDKLSPEEKRIISWQEFNPISLKKKYTEDDEITKLLDLYNVPEKEEIEVLTKSRWHTLPLQSLKSLVKRTYKKYGLKILISKMSREQLINALGQLLFLVDKNEYYS